MEALKMNTKACTKLYIEIFKQDITITIKKIKQVKKKANIQEFYEMVTSNFLHQVTAFVIIAYVKVIKLPSSQE